MDELKWTDKEPTEPGFYWLKPKGTNLAEIGRVKRITKRSHKTETLICELTDAAIFSERSFSSYEWSGPLTIPE